MSFLKWTKILPFFILKKLDTSTNRKNPVWIKMFDGWDCFDEPTYKEIKADIAYWFPNSFVLTSERFALEKAEKMLESELKRVQERLGR